METVDASVLLAVLQDGPRADAGCALLRRHAQERTSLRVHVWTIMDMVATLEARTGSVGDSRARVAADLSSLLAQPALDVAAEVLEALAVYGKYGIPFTAALNVVFARGAVIWSWNASESPGTWRAPT